MNQHRLGMYTDGILCIAATLLVLNFAVPVVPTNDNTELVRRLIEQWPKAVAYIFSFFVITNYWRLHNALFRAARVIDYRSTMLNALLLVTAAFIPYATNVVGTHPTLPAAAVLYSATLLIGTIAWKLLIQYLVDSNAYHGETTETVRMANRRMTVNLYVRVIALVLALFLPIVSYAIHWGVMIYYALFRELDAQTDSQRLQI
jgi:uncharacterized membrane protein